TGQESGFLAGQSAALLDRAALSSSALSRNMALPPMPGRIADPRTQSDRGVLSESQRGLKRVLKRRDSQVLGPICLPSRRPGHWRLTAAGAAPAPARRACPSERVRREPARTAPSLRRAAPGARRGGRVPGRPGTAPAAPPGG